MRTSQILVCLRFYMFTCICLYMASSVFVLLTICDAFSHICLSLCNTMTFESLDIGLQVHLSLGIYEGHGVKLKVTGAKRHEM